MKSTSDIDDRVRTEFVVANHLRFEVDMCGDGDKLALCLHGFQEAYIAFAGRPSQQAEDIAHESFIRPKRHVRITSAITRIADHHRLYRARCLDRGPEQACVKYLYPVTGLDSAFGEDGDSLAILQPLGHYCGHIAG